MSWQNQKNIVSHMVDEITLNILRFDGSSDIFEVYRSDVPVDGNNKPFPAMKIYYLRLDRCPQKSNNLCPQTGKLYFPQRHNCLSKHLNL